MPIGHFNSEEIARQMISSQQSARGCGHVLVSQERKIYIPLILIREYFGKDIFGIKKVKRSIRGHYFDLYQISCFLCMFMYEQPAR
jgi:hypothetical protein